jgi:lipopolysaccharide transport system ATP-binding protein
LLKILSRITEPTSGEARIRGRVASLLEVGTGFHPELTGRENIFLNGAILGMSKTEIRSKFDEIVAFAEIEKFIDTPVKRYSSGMYVRLAFAVAAHLDPEILIVDEVLAVGDASFQKKCLGKMKDVSGKDGRTVLFVSHNMAAVQNLCSRCVVLQNGRICFAGTADEAIDAYMTNVQGAHAASSDLVSRPRPDAALKPGAIFEAGLLNDRGELVDAVSIGSKISLFLKFKTSAPVKDPGFGFGLHDHFGDRLTSFNNYFEGRHYSPTSSGKAVWTIPDLPLVPGRYSVTLSIYSSNRECIDFVDQALTFTVVEADYFGSGKLPDPSQGVFALRGNVTLEP